jgi:hypothetical protein
LAVLEAISRRYIPVASIESIREVHALPNVSECQFVANQKAVHAAHSVVTWNSKFTEWTSTVPIQWKTPDIPVSAHGLQGLDRAASVSERFKIADVIELVDAELHE